LVEGGRLRGSIAGERHLLNKLRRVAVDEPNEAQLGSTGSGDLGREETHLAGGGVPVPGTSEENTKKDEAKGMPKFGEGEVGQVEMGTINKKRETDD
jgi:hypothetical protein